LRRCKGRRRAERAGVVAEGEELQTNLLQVSQRGPASSSALDEVFGTHSLREHIEQCSGDLNDLLERPDRLPPVQRFDEEQGVSALRGQS
jgi:hypothetical protein